MVPRSRSCYPCQKHYPAQHQHQLVGCGFQLKVSGVWWPLHKFCKCLVAAFTTSEWELNDNLYASFSQRGRMLWLQILLMAGPTCDSSKYQPRLMLYFVNIMPVLWFSRLGCSCIMGLYCLLVRPQWCLLSIDPVDKWKQATGKHRRRSAFVDSTTFLFVQKFILPPLYSTPNAIPVPG